MSLGAQYASQPTVSSGTPTLATRGRYSLLGPDFHRLDRTKLAWRTHSITLVGAGQAVSGNVDSNRLRRLLCVDDKFEFGCCSNRPNRLAPFRPLVSCPYDDDAPHHVVDVRTVGEQVRRPRVTKTPPAAGQRKAISRRKVDNSGGRESAPSAADDTTYSGVASPALRVTARERNHRDRRPRDSSTELTVAHVEIWPPHALGSRRPSLIVTDDQRSSMRDAHHAS